MILSSTGPAPNTQEIDGAIREVASGRRLTVISDSNVMPLYGLPLALRLGVLEPDCLTFPAGEQSKTRAVWARLTDQLLERGFGRDAVVVAVGGGVVGDLAGFVAATYMRGVPVIHVPTTLLAMIDASIGGKTGVDTVAGKNLVGAFHDPLLVIAELAALRTLPPAEFRAGLAEALKHALITSPDELDSLLASADAATHLDLPTLRGLVQRHVAIKALIVARDMYESGVRKTLNFGHTIGHAIESVSAYSILHGECVAMGMLAEARVAVAMRLAPQSLVERVQSALGALGLPSRIPAQMSPDALLAATRSDKKVRAGAVEYALLADVGQSAAAETGYGTRVPDAVVLDTLRANR